MWCIPPQQNGQFVARMERVLQVYCRPYDPRRPVVCMDEQAVQLVSWSRQPVPMSRGRAKRIDYEYVRQGTCTVWMFVEPLGCWRDVRVSVQKTAIDWAHQVRALVDDPRYADVERITLVCDNLNTHDIGSLYEAFDPQEAARLAEKLEIVHTPKHGSWLNMAEVELSVLTRQAFAEPADSQEAVQARCAAWASRRNASQTGIAWQFTTADARIKLEYLYPKIKK